MQALIAIFKDIIGGPSKGAPDAEVGDVNPYLVARKDVDDRLKLVTRHRFVYMLITGLLAVGLSISVFGNIIQATTSQVDPYYVVLGKESGEVLQSGFAEEATVNDVMIRHQIEEFITGVRSVYVDMRATRSNYEKAWAYLSSGSEAETFLRNEFNKEGGSPTQLVGELQRSIVEIEVDKVEGTRSWNIEWIEQETRSGREIEERIYRGSLSARRVRLTSAAALEKNPIGLYIDGLSWRETDSRRLMNDD